MNYFAFHIGDHRAATAHLTWYEDAAYMRLLILYYRKEQPIPADIGDACRLVLAATKEQRQAVEAVLREFFLLGPDGWRQKRCDAEIAHYQRRVAHNREVGKLGGRPPGKKTQAEPKNNPPGSIREPGPNPPQTPCTSLNTPLPPLEASACAQLDPQEPGSAGAQTDTHGRTGKAEQPPIRKSRGERTEPVIEAYPHIDPALQKILDDDRRAVPMPAAQRAQTALILAKRTPARSGVRP